MMILSHFKRVCVTALIVVSGMVYAEPVHDNVPAMDIVVLKENCDKAYEMVLALIQADNREHAIAKMYVKTLYKQGLEKSAEYMRDGKELEAFFLMQGVLVELNNFLVAAATNKPLIQASPVLVAKLETILNK